MYHSCHFLEQMFCFRKLQEFTSCRWYVVDLLEGKYHMVGTFYILRCIYSIRLLVYKIIWWDLWVVVV